MATAAMPIPGSLPSHYAGRGRPESPFAPPRRRAPVRAETRARLRRGATLALLPAGRRAGQAEPDGLTAQTQRTPPADRPPLTSCPGDKSDGFYDLGADPGELPEPSGHTRINRGVLPGQ